MENVRDIIAGMTLEEKVSLCSGKDFWQTQNLDRHGIPSIFLSDGPHGIRKQAASADHLGLNESLKATCFPTAAGMANTWNTELAEHMGGCLGLEAKSQGVNVLLGPGLNIKRNPLCGRNFEYFSEDPYLAGKMAAAYIRGIQSSGVSACPKHLAANSQETRRMVSDSVIDERALREVYLTNFEIAVREGHTKSIMTSYNLINGTYANENKHLLLDILRGEWDFNGVTVTDWGGNNDRVSALEAGNELEMPGTGGITNLDILNAVKSGRLSEKVLDENLERLLTLIFDTDNALKDSAEFDADRHHSLAVKAAEECIVLLENDGTLPLKRSERMCVIGCFAKKPRYQGAGSSQVNPTRLDTVLDCIGDYSFELTGYAPGFKRYGGHSDALLTEAAAIAEKSDIVLLFVGLDEISESEGLDRVKMTLPMNQLELIDRLKKTGKRIVAVLSCGAPVKMDWSDGLSAVMHSYLGGQGGARAILNVLSGKVNPSGKLVETYPMSYFDCASAEYFPGKGKTAEYRESIFVGYRYYDTAKVEVKYPFGYGLSYTEFEYSDLMADDTGVTFTITNTGAFDGAEIAQMYVGKPESALFRAEKELKGFVKIFLEKGEKKTVQIPFDEYTFRIFTGGRWAIEEGGYEIMIGSSSKNIRLSAKHSVPGEILTSVSGLRSYYKGKVSVVSDGEFETLLGRKLPGSKLDYIKKNRIRVDSNTPVCDLSYAFGWTGRLFKTVLRFAQKFFRFIGNEKMATSIQIGVYSMPLRGLSRMTGGAVSQKQLEGIITMFNGKFFKGLIMFLRK
jgi:beta-glucosidase